MHPRPDLTPEQQAVVTHPGGPAVVIACPGSGKTMSVTHRMVTLIREQRVQPSAILAITFTRAAAGEMKRRVGALTSPEVGRQVRIFTFHGLAWRIVTDQHGKPDVLDEQQQGQLIREILRELDLNADQTTLDEVLTDLARLTGSMTPEALFQPATVDAEHFRRIRERYRELKAGAGKADFDDLIIQACDLLATLPRGQVPQAARTQHLLVDEFQDTNALQWQFLQHLVPEGRNVMVVGDDDQAIYGWRGASPTFMLEFPRHFPDCRQLRLSTNFRCDGSIVRAAEQVISHNRVRFAKHLSAHRPPAAAPVLIRPATPAQEADAVCAAIQRLLAAGADPAGLAVLYRVHLQGYPLRLRLERAGIPCLVLGGDKGVFARWMTRDALAYVRWAWAEASLEEIARVVRRPARAAIPKDLVQEMLRAGPPPAEATEWMRQYAPPGGRKEIDRLARQVRALRDLPAVRTIPFIRGELGYDAYIDYYAEWSGSDAQAARDLLSFLEQIPEANEPSRVYLELAHREETRRQVPRRGGEPPPAPAVTLATLHSSKGLEWEQVWILGAADGGIPHQRVLDAGNAAALEEERRLFYVGMTRAKDALTISAPQSLNDSPATPSRFVVESGVWTPPPPPARHSRLRSMFTRSQSSGTDAPANPRAIEPPLPPALPAEDYAPGILCQHVQFGEGVIHHVGEQTRLVEVHFRTGAKVLSLDACLAKGLLRRRDT